MEISEQINTLLEKYDCTAKELADASGMSVSVISRYRSGTRHPSSEQMSKLAEGFAALLHEKGNDVAPETLFNILKEDKPDEELLVRKFNILTAILDMNMSEFARFCSYDPSLISRVKSRQRGISDPNGFARNIASFLYQKYHSREYDKIVADFIGTAQLPEDREEYITLVKNWMCSGSLNSKKIILPFAETLKEIDSDDYLRKTHFQQSGSHYLSFAASTGIYRGIDEMRRGELDFFRFVLNSDAKELYMFSEMPYNILAQNDTYTEEWLYMLSCIAQKGININLVHNIDKPFEDLLMGLRRLLPIYMTGRLMSYYIPGVKNNMYYHLCYFIDGTVMLGHGIYGAAENIMCRISCEKSDVEHYKNNVRLMMKKTRPLMNMYKKESENVFRRFLYADSNTYGERYGVFAGASLCFMSRELLESVFSHNDLTEEERITVLELYEEGKRGMETLVETGSKIHEDIFTVSEEQFKKAPKRLMILNGSFDRDIYYNYDEYLEHNRQVMEFAKKNKNYSVTFKRHEMMKDINFMINKGRWVTISHTKAPVINFVIRQPDIRYAMENIALMLSELGRTVE